jgi:hypothetical protein
LLVVLLVTSCKLFEGDASRIVALEIVGGTSYTAHVGDTLYLKARARAANGDTVSTAAIEWAVLDTGTVGIALDPSTGVVVATSPGIWRVQAKVATIRSDPITIQVLAKTAVSPRRSLLSAISLPVSNAVYSKDSRDRHRRPSHVIPS